MFGYYFEVTNSFKELVPDYFIRKQTLTNAERYTTDRLKELEDVIMGAEDRLYTLEYELFCGVRDQIAGEVVRIQGTAKAIAGARRVHRPVCGGHAEQLCEAEDQ